MTHFKQLLREIAELVNDGIKRVRALSRRALTRAEHAAAAEECLLRSRDLELRAGDQTDLSRCFRDDARAHDAQSQPLYSRS